MSAVVAACCYPLEMAKNCQPTSPVHAEAELLLTVLTAVATAIIKPHFYRLAVAKHDNSDKTVESRVTSIDPLETN